MIARFIGPVLMSVADALNAIHDNVWALVIIAVGGATYKRDSVLGTSLITLGAGLFRGATRIDNSAQNSNTNTNTNSNPKE